MGQSTYDVLHFEWMSLVRDGMRLSNALSLQLRSPHIRHFHPVINLNSTAWEPCQASLKCKNALNDL